MFFSLVVNIYWVYRFISSHSQNLELRRVLLDSYSTKNMLIRLILIRISCFHFVFGLFFEASTCPNTPPPSEHCYFPLLIKRSRVIHSFREKEIVMSSLWSVVNKLRNVFLFWHSEVWNILKVNYKDSRKTPDVE